jgi:hypothetical protein
VNAQDVAFFLMLRLVTATGEEINHIAKGVDKADPGGRGVAGV